MDWLANLQTYPWDKPLLPFGIGVAVIAWLLFRTEPRLRQLERAIDRLTRSVLILILTVKMADKSAKEEAGKIGEEIQKEDDLRNKKYDH
jgi:hypothetical protein